MEIYRSAPDPNQSPALQRLAESQRVIEELRQQLEASSQETTTALEQAAMGLMDRIERIQTGQ